MIRQQSTNEFLNIFYVSIIQRCPGLIVFEPPREYAHSHKMFTSGFHAWSLLNKQDMEISYSYNQKREHDEDNLTK